MRGGLEDTVSHRAEVKGNDKLDDDEKKECLCPCVSDIRELIIEKKVEEGNFNDKCKQDEGPYIPRKDTLFWIPRWSLHDIRVGGCNT